MGRRRPKNQLRLAFPPEEAGEARRAGGEGTERPVAAGVPERPATTTDHLMEEVCERANLVEALKRVKANRGSPGVDGMTVHQLTGFLRSHWPTIRSRLLSGTYEPCPVKRVDIPKPDGGTRSLGIPTVLDRFIQQAVLQVLQKRWDGTFSEHSYGFRPGRSAHQAVARAQGYVATGHRWVVDIDLEKFFDRVNHDQLMGRVAKRVTDRRVLRLIRSFLTAGMMMDGLVSQREAGTPQGGPLSPLLSNLLLDELDRELERRGLCFVRYADDCNIYVCSGRAGQRVMGSITRFLATRLRLTVNAAKSAVARPWARTFLGFSFTADREPKRRIGTKAVQRLKDRVRTMMLRARGRSLAEAVRDLSRYLTGWRAYFGYCQTPSIFEGLDSWIRRRLRGVVWRQWRRGRRRYAELVRRGVRRDTAAETAGSPRGPWRLARSPAVQEALPNAFFQSLGLSPLLAPPST
jgi:RNA-directed DNA polymerase